MKESKIHVEENFISLATKLFCRYTDDLGVSNSFVESAFEDEIIELFR